MRGSARRAGRPLRRLTRLLLGRNELRRPCDRIEGLVVASLSAAFLTLAVATAVFAGRLYQSQHAMAAPRADGCCGPVPAWAGGQQPDDGGEGHMAAAQRDAAVRHPDYGDRSRHL
jgi:hypothetical protein